MILPCFSLLRLSLSLTHSLSRSLCHIHTSLLSCSREREIPRSMEEKLLPRPMHERRRRKSLTQRFATRFRTCDEHTDDDDNMQPELSRVAMCDLALIKIQLVWTADDFPLFFRQDIIILRLVNAKLLLLNCLRRGGNGVIN
jgi:hypothetical protein